MHLKEIDEKYTMDSVMVTHFQGNQRNKAKIQFQRKNINY